MVTATVNDAGSREEALLLVGSPSPEAKLASQESSSITGSVVLGAEFLVAFWLSNNTMKQIIYLRYIRSNICQLL